MIHLIKRTLPWLIYPLVMALAVLFFFICLFTLNNISYATFLSLFFTSLLIWGLEKFFPYKKEWMPSTSDWTNDSLFFLFTKILFPKALVWYVIHVLILYINTHHFTITGIWPHQFSIALQLLLIIVISDFLRYWLHRLSHTFEFLWRFHAVHHSVLKLYWFNTSRFHPFEKGIHFLFAGIPFMLLGVSEEVIALHFVFYTCHGSFQHCNINLRYGWLNYVVSSSEHHRWHHSRNPEESNNNYGNTIIVWDIIFGSFYLPHNREVKELGLINKNYPLDFPRQMFSPLFNNYDKVSTPDKSYWNYIVSIFHDKNKIEKKHRQSSNVIPE